MTVEPSAEGQAPTLNEFCLRLLDAAGELKPIDGPQEIGARVRAVARELQHIQESLLLYLRCTQLDESGFEKDLQAIDDKLAHEWKPEAKPVGEIVEWLKERLRAGA